MSEDWQIKRDRHPALTINWIATSVERGRPVMPVEISCIFCKRTLLDDFKGEIVSILNAPTSLDEFGMSIGLVCRYCKQNYRFVVLTSFLG
jgi:hypothetical protein